MQKLHGLEGGRGGAARGALPAELLDGANELGHDPHLLEGGHGEAGAPSPGLGTRALQRRVGRGAVANSAMRGGPRHQGPRRKCNASGGGGDGREPGGTTVEKPNNCSSARPRGGAKA